MRAVRAVDPIAGPSKLPRGKSKEVSKGKKKAKSVREFRGLGETDDEGAMRCRRIAMRIVEKKVEVEMLWKEIEALEGMLEE